MLKSNPRVKRALLRTCFSLYKMYKEIRPEKWMGAEAKEIKIRAALLFRYRVNNDGMLEQFIPSLLKAAS